MVALVNVDEDWAIGKDGHLINRFKDDMSFFANYTMNKTIICGRKTLETFPNKCPLKHRNNIVITSSISNISKEAIQSVGKFCTTTDGTKHIHSMYYNYNQDADINTSLVIVNNIKDAVDIARLLSISEDDIVVVGGESIYKAMISYIDEAVVTKCYTHCDGADAFFPNLDEDSEWKIKDVWRPDNGEIKYEIISYKRVK